MRVLIVSIGFVLGKSPSDKHFVRDLAGALPEDVEIAIWSLNDAVPQREQISICGRAALYENCNRIGHSPMFSDGEDQYRPHPTHGSVRDQIEITVSMVWYLFTRIGRLISAFRPDVVHFTDSAGLVVRLLSAIHPTIPISLTKPTMPDSRSWFGPLYTRYIAFALGGCSKVLTFTYAAARLLARAGVAERKLSVIPWGATPPTREMSTEEKRALRTRYNCGDGDLLVVVGDRSLRDGIEHLVDQLATLLPIGPIVFVVAVRPTRYVSRYAKFSRDRMFIENGPSDFYGLLESADVVFSPVGSGERKRTSLLPLVWIEAMLRGTPVITEACPGVEDLVDHGVTGFTFGRSRTLFEVFRSVLTDATVPGVADAARCRARAIAQIDVVAGQYAETWGTLSQSSSGADVR